MALKTLPYARLEVKAANSLARVIKASRAVAQITSHLRSKADGVRLFESRYEPSSGPNDKGPWGDRRGPYKGKYWKRKPGASLPAAVPGTSKHEQGLAIDVPVKAALHKWLVKNPQYGWFRPLPTSDPVHFEYDVKRDKVRAAIIAKRDKARAQLAAVNKALGPLRWKTTKKRKQNAQTLLKKYGYYTGRIDGINGNLTKAGYKKLTTAAK